MYKWLHNYGTPHLTKQKKKEKKRKDVKTWPPSLKVLRRFCGVLAGSGLVPWWWVASAARNGDGSLSGAWLSISVTGWLALARCRGGDLWQRERGLTAWVRDRGLTAWARAAVPGAVKCEMWGVGVLDWEQRGLSFFRSCNVNCWGLGVCFGNLFFYG